MFSKILIVSKDSDTLYDFLNNFYNIDNINLVDIIDIANDNIDIKKIDSKKIYYINLFDIKRMNSFNNYTIKEFNNLFFYEKEFLNPIDISNFLETLFDNHIINNNYYNKFSNYENDKKINNFITIYISIDKNMYIPITKNNYNEFIKYLFERFPY